MMAGVKVMWACSTCSELNEGPSDNCWNCGTSRYTHYNKNVPDSVRAQLPRKDYSRPLPPDDFEAQTSLAQTGLILSSTPTLQTHTITEYLNVVSGEVALDTNIITSFVADLLGGRATTYEAAFKQARDLAHTEMIAKATQLEAHAIVGIVYETQLIATTILVHCWGTAVRLKGVEQ